MGGRAYLKRGPVRGDLSPKRGKRITPQVLAMRRTPCQAMLASNTLGLGASVTWAYCAGPIVRPTNILGFLHPYPALFPIDS